jgi:hypothetical protein
MSKPSILVLALLLAPATVDAAAQPAAAAPTADRARVVPPDRPQPLTTDQLAAVRSLSQQPAFAVPPETQATFGEDAEVQITGSDVSAYGVYAAWFGIVGGILITAL